jgi:hypothetical protein
MLNKKLPPLIKVPHLPLAKALTLTNMSFGEGKVNKFLAPTRENVILDEASKAKQNEMRAQMTKNDLKNYPGLNQGPYCWCISIIFMCN